MAKKADAYNDFNKAAKVTFSFVFKEIYIFLVVKMTLTYCN